MKIPKHQWERGYKEKILKQLQDAYETSKKYPLSTQINRDIANLEYYNFIYIKGYMRLHPYADSKRLLRCMLISQTNFN